MEGTLQDPIDSELLQAEQPAAPPTQDAQLPSATEIPPSATAPTQGSHVDEESVKPDYYSPYAASTSEPPTMPAPAAARPEVGFGKESVFRVDQSTSAWQTAKDALEAGMSGLVSTSQRTGGRRGRGPRRNLSPMPSGSITLMPFGSPPAALSPSTPSRGQSTPRGTPRGRGSRGGRGKRGGAGMKRRRGTDSDGDHDSTSSSEEMTTLPSQSRSGRKIIQATHRNPSFKFDTDDEPSEPQPSPAPKRTQSNGTLPVQSPATKAASKPLKKMAKRMPGASAVCRNCGRGHSPSSNAIVFCDGCNSAWHQYCHDPPIKHEFLQYVDRDWFCSDCVMLREHSTVLEGKVAGHGMSMLEKRKYLKTLAPSALIALLLHASSLHPTLPVFPPKPAVVTVDLAALDDAAAGLYEEVVDELPYPKAGHGVPLRPENDDAAILVDDNVEAYSHRWTGIAEMMVAAGWSGRGAVGVRTANSGLGIRAGAA